MCCTCTDKLATGIFGTLTTTVVMLLQSICWQMSTQLSSYEVLPQEKLIVPGSCDAYPLIFKRVFQKSQISELCCSSSDVFYCHYLCCWFHQLFFFCLTELASGIDAALFLLTSFLLWSQSNCNPDVTTCFFCLLCWFLSCQRWPVK